MAQIPVSEAEKQGKSRLESFTLLEILVVSVILGIVATLAISHYVVFREKGYDQMVKSNLPLIADAEGLFHMEKGTYINGTTTEEINSNLHLQITIENTPIWNYTVVGNNTSFTVQAERADSGQLRYWCMNSTISVPYMKSASACP